MIVEDFFGGMARLLAIEEKIDPRGVLIPVDFAILPFAPRRCFTVSEVPVGTSRGGHAHRHGWQLLLPVRGTIEMLMRFEGQEIALDMQASKTGLLVGPGVWCRQRYLSEGAVLLVLASEPFDPDSYLTQWT